MKLAVFIHEPLTDSGWSEIERNATPDDAANLARSWGSRGWRVLCVSVECVQEGWAMDFPALEIAK